MRGKQQRRRVNDQIVVSPLRVIDAQGQQLGIIPRDEALELATESGLDLVEVAPEAEPPVCRIMDYGKYRYEQSKRESKNRHHSAHVKEIQIRPRTQEHDLETKVQRARHFLERGDKVNINLLFRGREVAHRDLAKDNINAFIERLQDVAKVEQPITVMGRRMMIVLAPKK